jgi:hypothetical protein
VPEAAAVVGAVGVLAAVLGRTRTLVVAGLAALGLAELLLARTLLEGGLGSTLASAAGAAALAVGVPALAGLAAVFVRYPAAVPPVVVAAAPFRFPFEFGAENRFFVALADNGALGRLLPLYAVVAAAAVALGWRTLRGSELRPLPHVLAVPTALLVAFTVLSLLWAYDPRPAQDRLAFFVLPFAALLAVVARAPYRPWLPRVLALEAVALGCLFAAVGIGEAWARELIFYDPKVAVANEYTSYFRVTSLFSDPSIYGRHLAISIVVLVVALWLGRVAFVAGAAGVAFLWAGLYFSYSQSSMAALAAAVAVVTFLVADRKTRRWLAGAAVALVLVGAISLVTLLRDESAARVTSGRSTLVSDTLTVVGNHPVVGVGVASQPAASRDEADGSRRVRRNVSHTAPLTVAAELGVVGIVLYAAVLAGAVWLVWTLRRRDGPLGLALLGVFVVLFVHSLSYGVFFDDPLLWATLGVGVVGLAAREAARSADPAKRPRRSSEPAPAAG